MSWSRPTGSATLSPSYERVPRLSAAGFAGCFDGIVANIGRVIKGKDDVIRLCLVAMLANGHVLFEDLPGTGKTMLARAVAQTINADASRLQCTPDLLPADRLMLTPDAQLRDETVVNVVDRIRNRVKVGASGAV